jgi:hypothetical protein
MIGDPEGPELEVSLEELRDFLFTIRSELKELAALNSDGHAEEADRRGKQLAATIEAWAYAAAQNQN